MAQIKRSGEIRLGDARMCILENPGHVDDAYERGFKREVFRRIIQTLNRLGWLVVIPQDKIERYSASFARQFRYCTKGDLKADLKLCGWSFSRTSTHRTARITRADTSTIKKSTCLICCEWKCCVPVTE